MISPDSTVRSQVPTTGMRGGLGRTLLTAFLVMTILPLSAVSWYATRRERQDIEREVKAKLSSVAAMMEAQVRQGVEGRVADLAFLAALPATQENVSVLVSDPSTSSGQAPSAGSGQAPSAGSGRDPTAGSGQGPIGADSVREDAEAAPEDAEAARDLIDAQLQTLLAQDPAFNCLAMLDEEGQVLASSGQCDGVQSMGVCECVGVGVCGDASVGEGTLVVVQSVAGPDVECGSESGGGGSESVRGLLVGWLDLDEVVRAMQVEVGESGEVYLVDTAGRRLSAGRSLSAGGGQTASVGQPVSDGSSPGRVVTSPGIAAALAGEDGEGLYDNYASIPVIGVYHWMPDLRLALVAEQTQEEAFAPTNDVTAAIVGGTLVVALATAVIAAIVTRQITQPIVQLTESALGIAEGDMAQRVPIRSRDEIGILAYVFNHMVAELKALYDGLEEKVEQRTALLQEANYQIQRRAIQLATTVEVSQAATSILDADHLLREVAQLVHDSFAYSYVGIYLLDARGSDEGDRNPDDGNPGDRKALLQEATGGGEATGAIAIRAIEAIKAKPVPVGDGCAVGQAALTGEACIIVWDEGREACPYGPYVRAEAALPLRLGAQVIGVLDILSTETEDFDADAVSALQNVANQVTIALENARAYAEVARAYAVEREAAKRLRELDGSKRRFLSNMSHELRTPLTNIMGFSRLMLKGIEGPLTERLQEDVEIIYGNGQHLLGLINDLLDISHLEAGMMELEFRQVNLTDLIRSVMATASALVRDKYIELHQEIAPNLPSVHADAARIRQVLLRLLANAAKFTEEGIITVRCWSTDDQVLVSVSDTGVGIPREDQERIFERFEQGGLENGRWPHGAGLGLALSKEFVEMHGGEVWVESQVGEGSTFTFTLPLGRGSESAFREDRGGSESGGWESVGREDV